MNLKEYIDSKKDDELDDLRCSSCSNSIIHCGAYSIRLLEKGYEGLLCQDCLKAGRKVYNAIIITKQNKISYIEMPKDYYDYISPKPKPTPFIISQNVVQTKQKEESKKEKMSENKSKSEKS